MVGSLNPEPDRGWAWVVLISGLVIFAVNSLTANMAGVIYIALMNTYNEGESKTALVGALSNGFLCLFSPLNTCLMNKFGSRVTAVIGAVTVTGGFALSAVMPSLDGVICTAGVAVGIGHSMMCCSTVVSFGFYFQRYRNIATASLYLAVGTGMFGSTPLGLLLLDQFGLPSTFLILAALSAQLGVAVMLNRQSPLELEAQQKRHTEVNKMTGLRSIIDLRYLMDVGFLLYLINILSWNFAFGVVVQHLPNFLATSGASHERISLVFLIFAVSNTAGRLCGTVLSGRDSLNLLLINALAMGVCGIATVSFFYYSQFQFGSMIFASQLGFLVGIPNSTQMAVAIRFVDLTRLADAVSFVYFFSGIGVFMGPYMAGLIYGVSKSYGYSFITAGVVLIVGGACGWLGDVALARKLSKRDNQIGSQLEEEVKLALTGTSAH